jgi:hypothetical protein
MDPGGSHGRLPRGVRLPRLVRPALLLPDEPEPTPGRSQSGLLVRHRCHGTGHLQPGDRWIADLQRGRRGCRGVGRPGGSPARHCRGPIPDGRLPADALGGHCHLLSPHHCGHFFHGHGQAGGASPHPGDRIPLRTPHGPCRPELRLGGRPGHPRGGPARPRRGDAAHRLEGDPPPDPCSHPGAGDDYAGDRHVAGGRSHRRPRPGASW